MSTMPHQTISIRQTIALTMRVALEHHDRGQLQEAAALYLEIQSMDPAHVESRFLLGLIEASMGNLDVAIHLLHAAVRARPEAAHMHRALAETLYRAGYVATALDSYWRILSLEPANPAAFINVADMLVALKPDGGNDRAAERCYRRALELDRFHPAAHSGLGHIHERANHLSLAEHEYRTAIGADERHAASHAGMARVLFRQRRYIESADACRRAILLRPDSPDMLDQLGDALQQLNQSIRAQACHERAATVRAAMERASDRKREEANGPQGAEQWQRSAVPYTTETPVDAPQEAVPVQ